MILVHDEYIQWFLSLTVGDMVGYTNVYYVNGQKLIKPSEKTDSIFFKITPVEQVLKAGEVIVDGAQISINSTPDGMYTKDGVIMPVDDLHEVIENSLR